MEIEGMNRKRKEDRKNKITLNINIFQIDFRKKDSQNLKF